MLEFVVLKDLTWALVVRLLLALVADLRSMERAVRKCVLAITRLSLVDGWPDAVSALEFFCQGWGNRSARLDSLHLEI